MSLQKKLSLQQWWSQKILLYILFIIIFMILIPLPKYNTLWMLKFLSLLQLLTKHESLIIKFVLRVVVNEIGCSKTLFLIFRCVYIGLFAVLAAIKSLYKLIVVSSRLCREEKPTTRFKTSQKYYLSKVRLLMNCRFLVLSHSLNCI